jgi:hypothetical protein
VDAPHARKKLNRYDKSSTTLQSTLAQLRSVEYLVLIQASRIYTCVYNTPIKSIVDCITVKDMFASV